MFLLQGLGIVCLLVNHIGRGNRHILLPLGGLESILLRPLIGCRSLGRHIGLLGLPCRCVGLLRLCPPLIHRRRIILIHRLHALLSCGGLLLLPQKFLLAQRILLLLLLLIPRLCLLPGLPEKLLHIHTEEEQTVPNAQQHQQQHPGDNADGLPNGPSQQHAQTASAGALASQFPASAEEELIGVCRIILCGVQVQQVIHQGHVLAVIGGVHHQCQAGSQCQIKAGHQQKLPWGCFLLCGENHQHPAPNGDHREQHRHPAAQAAEQGTNAVKGTALQLQSGCQKHQHPQRHQNQADHKAQLQRPSRILGRWFAPVIFPLLRHP